MDTARMRAYNEYDLCMTGGIPDRILVDIFLEGLAVATYEGRYGKTIAIPTNTQGAETMQDIFAELFTTPELDRRQRFWERKAEEALSTLEQIQVEKERLRKVQARFGEDIYENGSIIHFQYMFHEGTTLYDYAMIKAKGLWYSTGPRAPKAFTWEQMCRWWSEAANEITLWYVDHMTEVMP